MKDDADGRFREHVVFALSQSREPKATDAIIEVAQRDPDAHVRGQALFWLAQKAGTARRRRPSGRAVDDDPEVEVKKKAVFALSQLPKDEGVPLLIERRAARTEPRGAQAGDVLAGPEPGPAGARVLRGRAEALGGQSLSAVCTIALALPRTKP